MELEPVIGLEIHAQLQTETKIFCGCSTAFGAPPNTNCCPVCLGLPGALPVLNERAVRLAIRAALALGCTVQPVSSFARKNYFYPDLPKGYQISQYEEPLATDGRVTITSDGTELAVGIVRVHLEEDAGKSLHEGFADSDRHTYVDFNRSGVPLVEIVTRPDLRSAADAAEFFSTLRSLLVALGVNDGNMEEGSLRCDANVSVRPTGQRELGVKTEVKNLNSFRFLQRALEHEIRRQGRIVRDGGRVTQETRLWNPTAGRTEPMRSKEEAHDYRYFPEPDLPPLEIAGALVQDIRAALPELPAARRARFIEQLGLPPYDAGLLTQSMALADFFEATVGAGAPVKAASNWIMGDLTRKLKEQGVGIEASAISAAALAGLIRMVDQGAISGPTAKDVFERMYATGEPADHIVSREGLNRIDDEARLRALVGEVIAANADAVAQYRSGRTAALGFLVGQVMKATRGQANPQLVNTLLRRALEEG